MTSPARWLEELPPTPQPLQLIRPGPATLVVYVRSGLVAAVACASILSALIVPLVVAFAPGWVALVTWVAATVALTAWLRAGISYTLTPAAPAGRLRRPLAREVEWVVLPEPNRRPEKP